MAAAATMESNLSTEVVGEKHTCQNCNCSLIGYRFILREEKPHCLSCYENLFAHACSLCKNKIGCDSKDLSFKDSHWHEKCFFCCTCQNVLMNQAFAMREDNLYCADCYDEKYATRCDHCNNVFKAGMKKYEYKGKQWHEQCFLCGECKKPIGTQTFIPHEQSLVCVPCYEAKYAFKCVKCQEVIRKGGVTYKNEPWHKACFTCDNCSKELAGLKFITQEERPYCVECYGELFAKKCIKCTKPITGIGGCKFISFEERNWHSECFNCFKCDVNLVGKGFLTEDEKVKCPDCGRSA